MRHFNLASMAVIFDDFVRTDASPKRNRESSFDFLNRAARQEIERVREFVESCAGGYPKSEIDELAARIRSGNDKNFSSATFELLLYAALERLNFKLEPHPQLSNGSKARPDFLVTTPDKNHFYLEAVLASEITGANGGGDAIKGTVFDALNEVSHPNFLINVMDQGRPTTQPSGKKLAREILNWLNSLDPDEVTSLAERYGFDAMPAYKWEYEDWSVTFRPIPIKVERRGKAKSLIGSAMGNAGFIDNWTPIRDAVKRKGSKYGELDLPLLVAVNMDTFALDEIDEMQALFGQEKYVFTAGSVGTEPRMKRAPNGAWYGPNGPQYTRVSGAWIFNDLSPYSVAGRRNTIYLNPWAAFSLSESVTLFPHVRAIENEMKYAKGMSLGEVFKLDESWPE